MLYIYGNSQCIWCERAKSLCELWGLRYEYRNIDEDRHYNDLKVRMQDIDRKTIPQIWDHDDNHIGGYEDLKAKVKEEGNGKVLSL